MPFPLDDLSQPFRRPRELTRLAQAVFDADDNDEHSWIEWKRSLDLMDDVGRRHLVKQILGFANRDPDVAARWCQGNAYLLVGVSPGIVDGITPIDPETLGNRLRPYIGPEVRWQADYTKLEGRTVLVIEVGPPAPGDTIHFLMRDLIISKAPEGGGNRKEARFHDGTIFIRRIGQVERANHAERQMLLRRARAAEKQLDVDVVANPPEIERTPLDDLNLASYLKEQRAALLEARYEPQQNDASQAVPAWFVSAMLSETDPRSWEEYRGEVDTYLLDLEAAIRDKFAEVLEEHQPAHLALVLENRSEQPFSCVQVTASISGQGIAATEDVLADYRLEYPSEPKPYGSPALKGHALGGLNITTEFFRQPRFRPSSKWRSEQTADALRIEFDPVDLHGCSRVALPAVPLHIGSAVPSPLTVHWTAASLDAPGRREDSFTLPVVDSTVPFEAISAD